MNYNLDIQTQFYIGKGVRSEAECWLADQGVRGCPRRPGVVFIARNQNGQVFYWLKDKAITQTVWARDGLGHRRAINYRLAGEAD